MQAHEPIVVKSPKTVNQAAAALGLSQHTVRAWIAQRRIAYIKLGRAIRIPTTEIDRLLQQGTVPAARTG